MRIGDTARIGLYFGAAFSVFGLTMPFFNVWLDSLGLSVRQIAAISILGSLVRLLAGPVLAFIADGLQMHRRLLIGLGWAAAIGWLAMTQASGFAQVIACHVAISLATSGIVPLIETVAMTAVRAKGLDYGRMRLWGSATFIVASLVGGWMIRWSDISIAVWMMLAAALAGACAGQLLPRPQPHETRIRPRLDVRDALALLRSPFVVTFLVATGAVQGAHAMLYVYGPLHWRQLGFSTEWTGLLWAVSVICEIALFWVSTRLLASSDPITFMLWGAAAAVVRWAWMAFDPPLALQIPLQALHALTYAASHLGAVHLLSRAIPERQIGTMQALYAATITVTTMLATELASRAFLVSGGRAYAIMSALALVSVFAVLRLRRDWDGRQQSETR